MNRVVTIFLLLCVSLLTGYNHAQATGYKGHTIFYLGQAPEKTHQVQATNANTDRILRNYADVLVENLYVPALEDDDDEEDEHKKQVAARHFATIQNTFVSTGSTCLSNPLRFSRHQSRTESCKYILQRVLRI
jgi:exonuclease III